MNPKKRERQVYQDEKAQNELLTETLEASKGIHNSDTVILTDLAYVEWTVAGYYYPEAECVLISEEVLPELEQDKSYWLMFQWEITENWKTWFENQGYSLHEAIKDGTLGTNPVTIYELKR